MCGIVCVCVCVCVCMSVCVCVCVFVTDVSVNMFTIGCILCVMNDSQGRRSVLKDCCAIADNTVLPPETVVPPFTIFSGSPGSCFYLGVFYHWPTLAKSRQQ